MPTSHCSPLEPEVRAVAVGSAGDGWHFLTMLISIPESLRLRLTCRTGSSRFPLLSYLKKIHFSLWISVLATRLGTSTVCIYINITIFHTTISQYELTVKLPIKTSRDKQWKMLSSLITQTDSPLCTRYTVPCISSLQGSLQTKTKVFSLHQGNQLRSEEIISVFVWI